jgi:hypothetical protein
MTFEQLLILALVVLLPLLNFLAGRVRRRLEEARPPEAVPVAPRAEARPRPGPPAPPERRPAPRIAAPEVEPPRRAVRRAAPAAPRSLREVRWGIVLMTVLGPCRALEPPPVER